MPSVLIREGASPATPSEGIRLWATVATPSIPMLEDDSGNDWAIARVQASGTWTPGVSFGGGTTGITYSNQVGRYRRVENIIHAWGVFTLSSKGSSTGSAVITGLPVAGYNLANFYQTVTLRGNDLSSITGHLQGYVILNTTTIGLEYLGTGSATGLTDSNFANNTGIFVTAIYEVA